ncbi:MAG TPA: AraC family transcriptional regulator [Pedobacter sp.]|uniref:AraC family transcriptional regulator n=1 Tax=Pedobacter sp. TaxID=1411316 RepID=UPI002D13B3AC|nr:AraC family transcriptional regulator [Pedobacter sp.]HMI03623.1 AraC family transcriptional regulator [Pedobacter sp.]
MKPVEMRFAKDFDKSFVVFRENCKHFPCPWHYHPEYELVLVTKSSGRRMVGDHIGYFDEGDLVIMGPTLPHVWVNDDKYINGQADSPADAIVIHFVDDFLGEGFFQIPEMESIKNFLELSHHGAVIKGEAKDKVSGIMKDMLNMNGIQRLASLISIFDIIASNSEYELLASPGFVRNSHLRCSDRFSKVTEYIMRNFNNEITLPEIASIANMAVTTFCNFFKEQYRITFIEYLNKVRIGYACKLLCENKQNIVEIAYESGFNNLANFNRQFKKLKNMTPSDYRRALETGDILYQERALESLIRSAG